MLIRQDIFPYLKPLLRRDLKDMLDALAPQGITSAMLQKALYNQSPMWPYFPRVGAVGEEYCSGYSMPSMDVSAHLELFVRFQTGRILRKFHGRTYYI